MPRGKPKTRKEMIEEVEQRREWLIHQPPLSSPCLEGRRKHQFRGMKTHGALTLRDHGDYPCFWCGKTYRQVKEEQKLARRRRQQK